MPVSTSELSYVGFWARFLSFVVDSARAMILIALIVGVGLSAPEIDWKEATDPDRAVGVLLQLLPRLGLDLLLIGVAFVLFWMFRSATPGKMLVSAVIVDAKTLGKPSTGQLIGRYLAYYASQSGHEAAARRHLGRAAGIDRDAVFPSRPEAVEVLKFAGGG